MQFKIRQGTPEDAEKIARVHIDAWRETYTGIMPQKILDGLNLEERTRVRRKNLTEMDSRNICLVIELDEDQIVGFSISGPNRDKDKTYSGEIYAIYLLKEYHGNGFGKSLFIKTSEELYNKGHESMIVWVLTENPTIGFYKKMGGEEGEHKIIEIGKPLNEISYCWNKEDFSKLTEGEIK